MLKYCTLTGADNTINPKDLLVLSQKYPFVEWGILYSESKMGTGRYPTYEWIQALTDLLRLEENKDANFALHVCGKAVKDWINVENKIEEIAKHFKRIQLNLRFKQFTTEEIKKSIDDTPDQVIITQHNEANKNLYKSVYSQFGNHAILFDTSGGRGVADNNQWTEPLPNVLCGYAGGLGPDNVASQLQIINKLVEGKDFYIDMEGKLRNDKDQFDLSKCEEVLKIVDQFIKSEYRI